MSWKRKWRALKRIHIVRHMLFALGCLIILIAPLVGLLPGPGGVFVFAAGVGLLLEASIWAKRVYVRFKRRWPKAGAWADWGLRRQSPKRRLARSEATAISPSSAVASD
jgi:hypothetical protein